MLTKYFDRKNVLDVQIDEIPSADLALVVVIPAINESGLLQTLDALKSCDDPGRDVEVIVVINHSKGAARKIVETNQISRERSLAWADLHSTKALRFQILYHPDLSLKKGGVGMARKIGMDEAARRLLRVGNAGGVIACFDADCTCDPGYLKTLVEYFATHANVDSASIYFEHLLKGLENDMRNAIVQYELHLRYFINAQRWANFPFAYQTIGSSMAVRASTYIKVGGMNTRKAGEDFYFLHKAIEREAHANLNTTTVFPSARHSDRVPFGTGKAITDLLKGVSQTTYNPQSFADLRIFFAAFPGLYKASDPDLVLNKMPGSIKDFLATQQFSDVLSEITGNTASQGSFEKRFFKWFNAFRLMKYAHFARDEYYPDVPVKFGVDWLFSRFGIAGSDDMEECLCELRRFDKEDRDGGRLLTSG